MNRRVFGQRVVGVLTGLLAGMRLTASATSVARESVQDLINRRNLILDENREMDITDFERLIDPLNIQIREKVARNGGVCMATFRRLFFNPFLGDWERILVDQLMCVDGERFVYIPHKADGQIRWVQIDRWAVLTPQGETKRQQLTRLGVSESMGTIPHARDIY
jgi:hypothetical protein